MIGAWHATIVFRARAAYYPNTDIWAMACALAPSSTLGGACGILGIPGELGCDSSACFPLLCVSATALAYYRACVGLLLGASPVNSGGGDARDGPSYCVKTYVRYSIRIAGGNKWVGGGSRLG